MYYYLTKFVENAIRESVNPEKDALHVDQYQIILCQIGGDLLEYVKHFFYIDDDLSMTFKYVSMAYSKTDDFKIIRSTNKLETIKTNISETFEDFHNTMLKNSSDFMLVSPQYDTLKSVSNIPFAIFDVMTDVQ